MQKIKFILLLLPVCLMQPIFADDMGFSVSKPCAAIAHACKAAGFSKDKKFWFDCMKPVILGQKVKGVMVDSEIIKTCREDKIEKMKKELAELESIK
jgi:hypothetical protein